MMAGTVHTGEAHIDLTAAPRPDGYRPITEMLWVWPNFAGPPADEAWRYVLSIARRLDTAHRQLERLREAVDRANTLVVDPSSTSPGSRETLFEALGEAELFMVCLYRALRMTADLKKHFDVTTAIPELLERKLRDVKEIRDAFEHIDERAFKLRRREEDPAALTIFEFQGFLFQEHTLRYHQSALTIDKEATELIIATRGYVVGCWTELCPKKQDGEVINPAPTDPAVP